MSGPQFMPFYIGDYLRDTLHLTTEQHGAYLLLLFACWTHGGRLPNNDSELAVITRLPIEQWKETRKKIEPFFKKSVKFLSQKRVNVELQRVQHLHDVRSKAGSKGGTKAKHARAYQNQNHIKKPNLETRLPRPRAREAPVGRKRNRENGALADIEAKPPRFAAIERSSKPAVRQPSNAKSRLMQKVARWLPEDAVAGFWAAMMGPDAQQTLDRAVEQMRASGWEDPG